MACADDPGHPLNDRQLETFRAMTDGTGVARSFSATGGILLGRRYDFDLTRPGIGLYGGAVGLAMIEGGEQPIDQAYLDNGSWEVEVAGRLYPAVASLRPLYDPDMKRIKC